MRSTWRFVLVCVIACGTSAPPAVPPAASSTAPPVAPPGPPHGELSAALQPLAWWLGDWTAETGGGREHWVAAGGAIYGIALTGDGFEVLIVDDGDSPGAADGVLRLIAMPGGARAVEFRQRALAPRAATFANDAHDYPKTITYARAGDELRATLDDGDRTDPFLFTRTDAPSAPDLETADRAFSADTRARGLTGWMAAFAPDGTMLRHGAPIAGAAIEALMGPLLARGRLVWAPIASRRMGDLGFTVGTATFVGTTATARTGAPAAGRWRSSYVTIWKRQPDGTWKVRFATGRVVHER